MKTIIRILVIIALGLFLAWCFGWVSLPFGSQSETQVVDTHTKKTKTLSKIKKEQTVEKNTISEQKQVDDIWQLVLRTDDVVSNISRTEEFMRSTRDTLARSTARASLGIALHQKKTIEDFVSWVCSYRGEYCDDLKKIEVGKKPTNDTETLKKLVLEYVQSQ